MISLQPYEQFVIARQLQDHTDATTYYVRAVVRNSITGAILKTINLTADVSDPRRFTKVYEVPADVSGLGFYIDITSSVYSDSGYTTKATTYGDELESYLVYDRTQKGGGGGADVDYKKIEKILLQTMKPLIDRKEIDLGPVLSEIRGVMSAVDAIEIPELDNSPVIKVLGDTKEIIVKAISEKPVTPVTDLKNVLDMIDALEKKEPNFVEVFKKIEEFKKLFVSFIEQIDSEKRVKNLISSEIPSPFHDKVDLLLEDNEDERIKNLL